jgi:hypothetical protein
MANKNDMNLEEEYENAYTSLSNASQIAKKIRSEDPKFLDDGGLLKAFAPTFVQFLEKLYVQYQVSLVMAATLIGITLCVGLMAKVYSYTDAEQNKLRATVVKVIHYSTFTPTFTPTITATSTITVTPKATLIPSKTPKPVFTDAPAPTISP